VLESQEDLDARISAAASNWDLERIAIVDKLIIRCAVAELMYMQDVPLKVAINEAVDIAKKFSTGDSSRFVNGVLDAIAKTFQNPA
jgi:N utilization substance protein B